MSKVMFVAGGEWQAPLIRKIREMGHFVLCTNLYNFTEGAKAADECIIADVLNKELNLDIAKEFRPDAVITDQSDIAVPTVAYVSERLGLRGIGTDIAELYTNKFMMREFSSKLGLPTPQYKLCENYEDAETFLDNYPIAVIKPLNSQSSRGVFIVRKNEDFRKLFEQSKFYTNGNAGNVIIEEYIDGVEFTVDGLKVEDKYYVLAISEKKHFQHNPNVASELYFSNTSEKYDYDELKRINSEFVKKSGLKCGITHAEYKFVNNKFYLIEIAARGGGTRISSDIVPIMSGVDHNRILVDYLLGNTIPDIECTHRDYHAVLKFFDLPAGRVEKIVGYDAALKIEGILTIRLDFHEGSIINLANDDRSRVGFYIAYGKNEQELLDTLNKLKQTLKITVKE